jgi:transmembrane sensor
MYFKDTSMQNKIDENLLIADLIYQDWTVGLSHEKKDILTKWVQASDENRQLMASLQDPQALAREWRRFNSVDAEAGWNKLQERIPALRLLRYDGTYVGPPPGASRRLMHWLHIHRYRLVGAFVALGSLLGFFVLRPRSSSQEGALDLSLGYEKTYLEQGEGQQEISLTDRPAGFVIDEGRMAVKLEQRNILLLPRPRDVANSLLTVHTARGGKCSVIMTDGSKVHLNAASDIRFATYYDDPQREVNLKGEGYFEVKPAAPPTGTRLKTPFIVHVLRPGSQQTDSKDSTLLTVTATGTTFNIKAYDSDSSIRATLVSGTLEILRPGDRTPQQLTSGNSYILNRDGTFRVQAAGQTEALSWKDGRFTFADRPLDEIMQELCRAYDVKVEYRCTPIGLFSLMGFRDQRIEDVLSHIEGAGNIHFTFQDHTIIVSMAHSS